MNTRIASFTAFWPHYISEHRAPASRWLHFVGTSTFLALLLASAVSETLRIAVLVGAVLLVGRLAWRLESRFSAAPVLLAMIAMMVVASPALLLGVIVAYACAWIGHFLIEKNRPATFRYPLWSLAADFRMYGLMLRGKLWSGDASEIAPR